jgi:hypothetical protein
MQFFLAFFSRKGLKMGLQLHHQMPGDGEWDVDYAEESEPMIADNRWFKLVMLPVQFVLFLLFGILAILACSFLLSPVFIFWKVGGSFCQECRKVFTAFFGASPGKNGN